MGDEIMGTTAIRHSIYIASLPVPGRHIGKVLQITFDTIGWVIHSKAKSTAALCLNNLEFAEPTTPFVAFAACSKS